MGPEINRAIPILTGLGCSYKCTFCENALLGHKHFSMSADDVMEQILYYKENFNIDSFAFFDEDFFHDKKRLFQLIELLEKHDLGIKWGAQSRANYIRSRYIDAGVLKRLAAAGCVRISMGVESGAPRMLKKIKKGLTREMVLNAAEIAKDSSIYFSYSFIVQLPGETRYEFLQTFDLIHKLQTTKKNSFVSAIHYYLSYPGTPLSLEMEEEHGIKLEGQLSFEDFALYDLKEYNSLVNPQLAAMDMVRECALFHFRHREYVFNFENALRSPLRLTKLIYPYIFRIIGNIRYHFNFYYLPFEIYFDRGIKRVMGK